jgi:hypothetical protein
MIVYKLLKKILEKNIWLFVFMIGCNFNIFLGYKNSYFHLCMYVISSRLHTHTFIHKYLCFLYTSNVWNNTWHVKHFTGSEVSTTDGNDSETTENGVITRTKWGVKKKKEKNLNVQLGTIQRGPGATNTKCIPAVDCFSCLTTVRIYRSTSLRASS